MKTNYTIPIGEENVPIVVRRHARARRATLKIAGPGRVTLTLPRRTSLKEARVFILNHTGWIQKNRLLAMAEHKKREVVAPPYHQCRARALSFFRGRVEYWNKFYGFRYTKIAVRNQSTRWGSCSRSGTLSFNYRLMYLSERLADYVVVHELCHLKEMNHSKKFWDLVGNVVKDYKERRNEIRRYSSS